MFVHIINEIASFGDIVYLQKNENKLECFCEKHHIK